MIKFADLAQLVRASILYVECHRFESCIPHEFLIIIGLETRLLLKIIYISKCMYKMDLKPPLIDLHQFVHLPLMLYVAGCSFYNKPVVSHKLNQIMFFGFMCMLYKPSTEVFAIEPVD